MFVAHHGDAQLGRFSENIRNYKETDTRLNDFSTGF